MIGIKMEILNRYQLEMGRMKAEIDRLRAELAAANLLVERSTCKTRDGQRYTYGSKVYYVDPAGYVQSLDVGVKFRTDSSAPSEVYYPFPVFSTRAAAEAYRNEKLGEG